MKFRTAVSLSGLLAAQVLMLGCISPYAYYCGDGCGSPAAVSGRYGDCGVAPCAGAPVGGPGVACGPCGAGCGHCAHTLTGLLRSIFTCGAGCGELYWGEWCYDPPDACDPCDDCGNFVGPGCCGPTCWQRFGAGVHGGRLCPVGCQGGCSACCDVQPACGCDAMPDGGQLAPGGMLPTEMPVEILETGEAGFDSLPSVLRPSAPQRGPGPWGAGSSSRAQSGAGQWERNVYYSRHPESRLVRRPGR